MGCESAGEHIDRERGGYPAELGSRTVLHTLGLWTETCSSICRGNAGSQECQCHSPCIYSAPEIQLSLLSNPNSVVSAKRQKMRSATNFIWKNNHWEIMRACASIPDNRRLPLCIMKTIFRWEFRIFVELRYSNDKYIYLCIWNSVLPLSLANAMTVLKAFHTQHKSLIIIITTLSMSVMTMWTEGWQRERQREREDRPLRLICDCWTRYGRGSHRLLSSADIHYTSRPGRRYVHRGSRWWHKTTAFKDTKAPHKLLILITILYKHQCSFTKKNLWQQRNWLHRLQTQIKLFNERKAKKIELFQAEEQTSSSSEQEIASTRRFQVCY